MFFFMEQYMVMHCSFTTFWSIWILFYTETSKFQVQPSAENFPQYGGPGPVPGAWGAYDMQRAQGHR